MPDYPWGDALIPERFDEHTIASEALRDNPLGDPHDRPIWVYVPPGYDDEPSRRYPSVYMIQGLTGQLDMWRNRSPFRKNFPELADDLFARGEAMTGLAPDANSVRVHLSSTVPAARDRL